MEDKKEVKDLIKVRKSIFSVIKEMLKEKLIPKKDFSVDIEREKNAFRTFDEIYGVDEEAYAIKREPLITVSEVTQETRMFISHLRCHFRQSLHLRQMRLFQQMWQFFQYFQHLQELRQKSALAGNLQAPATFPHFQFQLSCP